MSICICKHGRRYRRCEAHAGFIPSRRPALTPKDHVLLAEPNAIADYYETLRASGQPCWFVRAGLQGPALSDICATPRDAWRNAFEGLRASLIAARKGAA